jgi:hypothetical protein
MKTLYRLLLLALVTGVFLCLSVIAYKLTFSSLATVRSDTLETVDYTNVVVILLTTVTILFTVFALILAILGVWGFHNIKIDAGKFAQNSAIDEIRAAFDENGEALKQIQQEFQNEGPLREWVQRQIRSEVTEQLALYTPEQIADEDDPTDEGDQS